jgi:hypothetical protein
LIYKKEYTPEEITDRVNFIKNEQPVIDDFSQSGNRIAFSITRFKKEEKARNGILNVRICMSDQRGDIKYQKERTLRATDDRVRLAVALPSDAESELDVKITVVDMVGNHQVVLERKLTP